MIKVAPSILAADFTCLLEEVRRMEDYGADWLHIDIMDGHFVPNITFGPAVVQALKGKVNLFMDVHLMVEQPGDFLHQFQQAGAQLLTVHVETCPHLHRAIQNIKKLGCKAGVALNPATPPGCLDFVLEDLDLVLVMSVNPGFGGQSFIPSVLPKIRSLADEKRRRSLNLEIQVDGGIDEKSAAQVVAAGADVLVTGSALFSSAEPQKMIQALKMLPRKEMNV